MYKFIKKTKTFIPSGFSVYGDNKTANVGKNEWFGNDSETLFKENLKKMPMDWYYRTNKVTYTVNSLGYRAPEFCDIDWKNSVVVFGCSAVFGVGVDDNHTVCSFLSDIIEMPVINMGSGGSGIHLSHHNSLILNEFYPTPKAIVHMWTNFSRMTLYNNEVMIRVGVHDHEFFKTMRFWYEVENNAETWIYFARLSAKQIWEKKCLYFDFTWDKLTSDITGCESPPNIISDVNTPIAEKGRDLVHQGKDGLKKTANFIAQKLFQKGLSFNYKNIQTYC